MEDVHLFLGWAAGKYKFNTIQSTISVLVDWHKSKGIPYTSLSCKPTKELLNIIKMEQGSEGMPAGKTGMSKPLLRLLVGYLHNCRSAHPCFADLYLRDSCWTLLGFYGMLRRSEIIALQLQDVTVGTAAGSKFIELRIRRSKNDRRGEGAVVTIAGVTKDNIRIADVLEEWLVRRQQHNPPGNAPLFTKWDLDKYCLSAAPITTAQALNLRLKTYLTELKAKYPNLPVNPSTYGMHSLRRGGVMAAWLAGVDVEKIKAHGRWRSDAIRAYMQTTTQLRLVVTTAM